MSDTYSRCGMPGETMRTGNRIAQRRVTVCSRGSAVAEGSSHGFRHDPAIQNQVRNVSAAIVATATADARLPAPPCDPDTAPAWWCAPFCGAKPTGAQPAPIPTELGSLVNAADGIGVRRLDALKQTDLGSLLHPPPRAMVVTCEPALACVQFRIWCLQKVLFLTAQITTKYDQRC